MEDESTTRQALLEELSDLKKKILEVEQILFANKIEKPGQTDQHSQFPESEEHYHALFQYSKDAILLTQPDGAILDANPAACELFGRSLDEIQRVGRNGLVDLTDPRLHAALAERAKKSVVKAEITMLHANGEKFPAEMTSAVFVDAGGQRKTSMIIRDMTEKHRIEQDFQSLFEQMLEGFMLNEIICDAQGQPVDYRFLKVNPAFERMTGMKAEQIISFR